MRGALKKPGIRHVSEAGGASTLRLAARSLGGPSSRVCKTSLQPRLPRLAPGRARRVATISGGVFQVLIGIVGRFC